MTRKASHRGNDELFRRDYPQARVSRHCPFIRDDRVAQLDILSVVAIVAFVPPPASKLSTAIHHLLHTASYGGYCFWVGETDSGLCANFKLSDFFFFPRIEITSYFNNGVKLMKEKRGDKRVTQSLPPSLELPL